MKYLCIYILLSLTYLNATEYTKEEASRYLMQSTFGPTANSIKEFQNIGDYPKWIENQIEKEGRLVAYKYKSRFSLRRSPYWRVAIGDKNQLRQRMAFALSRIFVAKARGSTSYANKLYYNLLIKNAFTDFESLLYKVSVHPVMGDFLDMAGNVKGNEKKGIYANENYAREILQLFSLGLYKLNMDGSYQLDSENEEIPAYTQRDVEELAKVFTGWSFDTIDNSKVNSIEKFQDREKYADYTKNMKCYPQYHDTSEKVIFNEVISENQSCEQDLKDALYIISNHSNIAPMISKTLIQKFITSNPSSRYIEDISEVFKKNNGNLGVVISNILTHKEATNYLNDPNFGKIKEPLIKLMSVYRGLNVFTEKKKVFSRHNVKQDFLEAPSVFGYFSLEYSPFGELSDSKLLAPEFEMMTDIQINNALSAIYDLLYKNNSIQVRYFSMLKKLEESEKSLVDYYNVLFFAGSMSENLQETLLKYIIDTKDIVIAKKQIINDSLWMVLNTPEFALQK
jgi:uncharacterized protein (DUF1800 family)